MEFIVEDGTVVDVKGGTLAATIRQSYGEVAKKLEAKDRESVWTVAEFGFGMNPSARLVGNVLEDEKRMGSCYFSIGDNTALVERRMQEYTFLASSQNRVSGWMIRV